MKRKPETTHEIGAAGGANCSELLAVLSEYVDGPIDPGVCAELQQHLTQCIPCRVVVDNLRQTITLYRNGKPFDMPAGFRSRLRRTLRQHWKQSGPRAP
jgi:hypothetical protein